MIFCFEYIKQIIIWRSYLSKIIQKSLFRQVIQSQKKKNISKSDFHPYLFESAVQNFRSS